VVPGLLQAVRVEQAQHGIDRRCEGEGLDRGDERLARLQLHGERIDIAGFLQTAIDGGGKLFDQLRRVEVVVGLFFVELRLVRHNEEAQSARTLLIKQPNQMRADRRVCRDFDIKGAIVRLGPKHDTLRIDPRLGRPGIKFAYGSDPVRCAGLEGDGEDVIERGRGGEKASCSRREQSLD
jgi:hypothetical protein